MIRFFEPLLCLCFGLGLLAFGLVHSAGHLPQFQHLHEFWSAMPAIAALILFVLGVVAVVSGLALLSFGTRGIRRRLRQIRHAYRSPDDEDDEEMAYHRQQHYGYR